MQTSLSANRGQDSGIGDEKVIAQIPTALSYYSSISLENILKSDPTSAFYTQLAIAANFLRSSRTEERSLSGTPIDAASGVS